MRIKVLLNSHLYPNKNEPALAPFMKPFSEAISKFVELVVVAPIPHDENVSDAEYFKDYKVFHPKYKTKLYDFPSNPPHSRAQIKRYFNAVSPIAYKEKPDLIHSHFLYPDGFIGAKLKEKFHIPLVITLHGSEVFDRKESHPLWKEMDYALDKADILICPHPEMVDLCLKHGISKKKLVQIQLPIDTDVFNKNVDHKEFSGKYKLRDTDKKIIFVGRFAESKDPMTLIKSMSKVIARDKKVHFIFVGDDDPSLKPLRKKMESFVKKNKIQRYATFTGFVDNVNEALAGSDIFVSLNTYDNIWTMAPLEAMSSSKPCILTKAGYTEKFLKHKKDAYLIQCSNPDELADAIICLMNDEQLARKLGSRGRKLVMHNFTKEKVGKQTYKLYEKLVRDSSQV